MLQKNTHILAIFLTFLASCKPFHEGASNSEMSGIGSFLRGDFGNLFGVPDVKPRNQIIRGFMAQAKTVSLATRTTVLGHAARSEFERAVIREIVARKGILSDQIHDALRDLTRGEKCDGVSCAAIFGFKESEVDQFLDDLEKKAATSPALNAPEASTERGLILSSLRRLQPAKTLADIQGWFRSLKKFKPTTEGTCLVPAVSAFGLRSNGPFAPHALKASVEGPVDYRTSLFQPKFQGATNTCHTFAMTSLLQHSNQRALKRAKEMDTQRTALAMWVSQLGKDVDAAIDDETEYLSTLAGAGRRYAGSKTDSPSPELNPTFALKVFAASKLYKQGGSAQEDFRYLQSRGGVPRIAGRPEIDFSRVEEFTLDLARARFSLISESIRFGKPINRESVNNAMGPLLKELFAFARKETGILDSSVAKEMGYFEYVQVDIPTQDPEKILANLTRDLAAHGPLYISANSHATTIVGYGSKEHTFWVTNSSDMERRAYSSIDAESLVRTLKYYSYLKAIDP